MIMVTSHRKFFRNVSGRKAFNFNLSGADITRRSAIVVTAAPCALGSGGFLDPDIRLNVHGPDVRVSNVVPHGPEPDVGGVEFVLAADAPTDVAVTITVLDKWDRFTGP
jgi:hypothetical protein